MKEQEGEENQERKYAAAEQSFLILFSYVEGEFVNLAPYQKYKRMEDFIRK